MRTVSQASPGLKIGGYFLSPDDACLKTVSVPWGMYVEGSISPPPIPYPLFWALVMGGLLDPPPPPSPVNGNLPSPATHHLKCKAQSQHRQHLLNPAPLPNPLPLRELEEAQRVFW